MAKTLEKHYILNHFSSKHKKKTTDGGFWNLNNFGYVLFVVPESSTRKVFDEGYKTKLTVAIVTWNSGREIGECLASLQSLAVPAEIVVCDNASSDDTVAVVGLFRNVRLVEAGGNLGFAGACNLIASNTVGEYILFLNPDTVVPAESVEKAVDWLASMPEAGFVTVRNIDENGNVRRICQRFPSLSQALLDGLGLFRLIPPGKRKSVMLGDFFDGEETIEIDWAYGAFMLVRRQALEDAGGVPEDYFLFAEDTDLCYQIRKAGWKNFYYAGSRVIHKGNRSAGQLPSRWRIERTVASRYAFCIKNLGGFRSKLIAIADLAGNVVDSAAMKLRGKPIEDRLVKRLHRAEIARCICSRRGAVLSRLRTRP